MTKSVPCVVCGSLGAEALFDAKGLAPSDPHFYLRQCGRCGMAWTEPKVSDAEIAHWYPPAYYGKGNVRFNMLFEKLVRIFRMRRAQVIARHAQKGAVLDVGCGRGLTLNYLRSLGYDPHGVEMTEDGAWHAKHKLGMPVQVGNFVKTSFHAEKFNAIIFWHSLEHISDPVRAIEKAKELLKPGGLLVIAVPNFESFQAELFGPNWFHLDIPRHYFHFGKSSLELLLTDMGFALVQEDHFSLEQNPYGWLQSFYNVMGSPFNFLYSILKNRTSRLIPIKKYPIRALITLCLLPVLLPLSLLFTVLEAVFRRGGTIELYAVKK